MNSTADIFVIFSSCNNRVQPETKHKKIVFMFLIPFLELKIETDITLDIFYLDEERKSLEPQK